MKKAIRLLSLALAIFTLPLALIACSNEADTQAGTYDENSPIELKNYGETFNYLVMDDIFPYEYFYAAEKDYSEMTDSIYQRQLNVKANIGVEITAKQSTDFKTYATEFETSIDSGSNTYQLCLTHTNIGVATFATKDCLYDFADFESVNLSASYWNKSLMNTIKYKDQYLLGYGDMCLASVYTVAFNKTLLNKHCQSLLGNETIYDLVDDNKWTLGKLYELASVAHEDDGNGQRGAEDRYGLTGMMWVPACSFLHSSNTNISRYNSNTKSYELCIDNNKTPQVIEKIRELYNAEFSFFSVPASFPGNHDTVEMKTGRTLFELTGSYNLVNLKETNVKFGVLPYPLFDENQKDYRSLSWNGYMVVPYNIDKFGMVDMVGDTLELLQYYSKPVTTAFYEKLLGAQVSEAPDDAYMLEIIWDSQVSDFAMTYSNTGSESQPLDALLYAIPRVILGIDGSQDFSGFYETYEIGAQSDMKKIQNIKKN